MWKRNRNGNHSMKREIAFEFHAGFKYIFFLNIFWSKKSFHFYFYALASVLKVSWKYKFVFILVSRVLSSSIKLFFFLYKNSQLFFSNCKQISNGIHSITSSRVAIKCLWKAVKTRLTRMYTCLQILALCCKARIF